METIAVLSTQLYEARDRNADLMKRWAQAKRLQVSEIEGPAVLYELIAVTIIVWKNSGDGYQQRLGEGVERGKVKVDLV